MMMMMLGWLVMATALFLLRPARLRNQGDAKPSPNNVSTCSSFTCLNFRPCLTKFLTGPKLKTIVDLWQFMYCSNTRIFCEKVENIVGKEKMLGISIFLFFYVFKSPFSQGVELCSKGIILVTVAVHN